MTPLLWVDFCIVVLYNTLIMNMTNLVICCSFQADVCHAYQVIHSHGIPDEQIVVMMYDDIANNPQ